MDNENHENKILTALWLVLFAVAGISYAIYFKLAINIYYFNFLFLRQLELVFLSSSILGYAIYMQTKKTLTLKILVGVLLMAMMWSHYLQSGPDINLIELFLAIALPFVGIFGSKELFNRKKKSLAMVSIIGAVLLNVGMLGYYGYDLIDDLNCNQGGGSLTPAEVASYNAEFITYEGMSNVKGSNIQQVIKNVESHNRYFENDSTKWINVHVYDKGSDNAIEEAESHVTNDNGTGIYGDINVNEYNEMINTEFEKVKVARTYAVDCGYDSEGYVLEIVIVQNSK